jgi:HSP20 family protein
MSLFPRFQEFSPLFRLLDDYDRVTRQVSGPALESMRSFSPKFDVKELKDHYELHGELPGIEQKDVSIEWTDGNTLTISGRIEHRSERGQRPAGFIEGEQQEGKQEGKQEGQQEGQHDYHKPTVEEEGGSSETAMTTANKDTQVAQKPQEEAKYWVTERSVGEFHRSFSFPTRVDQDNVKASLKNGILSIVVPKAQAPKPRKISIE